MAFQCEVNLMVHFTLHPALTFRGCGFQGAQATEDQDTESKSDLTGDRTDRT